MRDQSLATALHITAKLREELFDRELESTGLCPGQARVLDVAAAIPGLTLGRLCEKLNLDKSTVSRSLKALVAIRYLEVQTDQSDRRCHRYGPTGMGKVIMREIADIAREIDEIMQAGLAPDDRARVRHSLAAMASNLSQEIRQPGRRCAIFPDIHPATRHPSEGTPP